MLTPLADTAVIDQAQSAKKALREGRARYLKAKKEKEKQKKRRADEWVQQANPGFQDKPEFGEQILAPPKVQQHPCCNVCLAELEHVITTVCLQAALKRKHRSDDTQAAAALEPSRPALQQAAAQMKSSAALMDAKRQKADTGRATMASLKRLVAQQAAVHNEHA